VQNNNRCLIYIWDTFVGEMVLVKSTIYFKYDKDFKMNISPLSLELSKTQYCFKELNFQYSIAGVFADSLPDSFGMKVIDGYFESNYKHFEPNIPIALKDAKSLKKTILQSNSFSSIRVLIDMYKSFSPAGGAKQKMILNYNQKDEIFYIGKEKNSYKSLIVKIDESDVPYYGVDAIIEFIYSKVAKICGINITQTYLFEDEDGYKHFAIERFDIDKDLGRLHTHTLSGLLHIEKSKRMDYIEIMKIAKLYLSLPQEDIDEMMNDDKFRFDKLELIEINKLSLNNN